MLKALLVAATLGAISASGAGIAVAQDAEVDDKTRAQELYNDGLRAYNVGEFDRAIADWKSAYQLLGVPDFLFNIAQAYRQKKNYSEAVFFYNAYLRGKPDAPNTAEVTALRDEMAALLASQKSTEEMPPDPTEVANPKIDVPDESTGTSTSTAASSNTSANSDSTISGADLVAGRSENDAGKSMRLGGLIAGGTGIAFVATGVAFALSSSSTESDLEKAAANGEPWSDKFADKEDSAKRSATVGTVLMVTGVAAIIGGGAMYYLGRKKGEESRGFAGLRVEPTLELSQGDTRAGFAAAWNF